MAVVELLNELIADKTNPHAILFVASKNKLEQICSTLRKLGISHHLVNGSFQVGIHKTNIKIAVYTDDGLIRALQSKSDIYFESSLGKVHGFD
jgi:diaminopimelate epimerase